VSIELSSGLGPVTAWWYSDMMEGRVFQSFSLLVSCVNISYSLNNTRVKCSSPDRLNNFS
jgi:hypothetical protein